MKDASAARLISPGSEAALGAYWAAGARSPLRLADGRALRVVFPGVPGGASGPDFRGAILDAEGDLLRGDVELHLRASGWRSHGHHRDPAYAGVVLHVVAEDDVGARTTLHINGRAIPVLLLTPPLAGDSSFPAFTPPCAIATGRGLATEAPLERLSLRRLRLKAARVAPLVATAGAAQALYALALEQLGGSTNRPAFAELARRLPLAALLEAAECALPGTPRAFACAAALRAAAAPLALKAAGMRPQAAPAKRIESAALLVARWWPSGASPSWPAQLSAQGLLAGIMPAGLGRASAIELAANAVLPVALAAGVWPEQAVTTAWLALPSPGTYGKLRPLERWLGYPRPAPLAPAAPGVSPSPAPPHSASGPFTTAARLQGGLLLHADYCTKGACGRCPLSE